MERLKNKQMTDLMKDGVSLNSETMTSLQIAEITGKEHFIVMRDIRNLIDSIGDIRGYRFVCSSYMSKQNKEMPMYELNKKETLLLASGYNTILRAKIINRWEELETEKQQTNFAVPQTLAQALRLAADQAEVVEKQQLQLEAQKPKVLFADTVETAENSILIGELAKIISQKSNEPIGQTRMFAWLRENGYLSKRKGESWNMPNQRYVEQGLFEIKERVMSNPNGSSFLCKTTKVTGSGMIYFVNKFLGK